MILAMRVLQSAVAAVVCYIYWPDAWAAIRTNAPERGDYLVLGIYTGWLATMCQGLYSVTFRLAGNPMWLINADPVGLWIMMSVMAGVLHVLAPEAIGGTVPRRNRIAVGGGLGCAIVVVLVLLAVRPDVGPAVERLKPYISDWFKTGNLFGPPTAS
ncbi:hypothetical protein [Methylobacterium oryzisoli]|uniref:hypothetical protein n=1 Tax=Methylobacterium oryzisoli TaxID=3385502 RepID=UPI003891B3D0